MVDETTLDPDIEAQLIAQKRRIRAYEEGVYELDDDEGFYCEDCDWRGLFATFDLESETAVVCKECGGVARTFETPVDEFLGSVAPQ